LSRLIPRKKQQQTLRQSRLVAAQAADALEHVRMHQKAEAADAPTANAKAQADAAARIEE
jgi:hypothetical protein